MTIKTVSIPPAEQFRYDRIKDIVATIVVADGELTGMRSRLATMRASYTARIGRGDKHDWFSFTLDSEREQIKQLTREIAETVGGLNHQLAALSQWGLSPKTVLEAVEALHNERQKLLPAEAPPEPAPMPKTLGDWEKETESWRGKDHLLSGTIADHLTEEEVLVKKLVSAIATDPFDAGRHPIEQRLRHVREQISGLELIKKILDPPQAPSEPQPVGAEIVEPETFLERVERERSRVKIHEAVRRDLQTMEHALIENRRELRANGDWNQAAVLDQKLSETREKLHETEQLLGALGIEAAPRSKKESELDCLLRERAEVEQDSLEGTVKTSTLLYYDRRIAKLQKLTNGADHDYQA